MGFARSYNEDQPLDVLGAVEGTVVIRLTPQRNPLGPGSNVLCLIGEFANDQGSNPSKSIARTLREITSIEQLSLDYGGVTSVFGTAQDGYEGNASVVLGLHGFKVPRLVIVSPDLSAGQVTFTRDNGGPRYTIAAGTLVSDGANKVYATLEDVSFPLSGSEQTASVRVRPLSSAVAGADAEAIDTLVSTLDPSVTGVSNEAALVPPNFDTAYEAAIDATLGDTDLQGQITHVLCRRHTELVRTKLISNATAAAEGRRGRRVFFSPPIGTANATAIGSSGVGVGASGARSRYLTYAYPGIRTRTSRLNNGELFSLHSDVFAAQQFCSNAWYENPARRLPAEYVVGLESGIGVQPSQSQYISWRSLGIASPQITPTGPEILSDRTTDLTSPYNAAQHVDTGLGLSAALHDVGEPWQKKLRNEENKKLLLSEVNSLLTGLLGTAIRSFALDDESGNTPQTLEAGIHVIKALVQTSGSMRTIVFKLNAGDAVDVAIESL